MKERIALTDGSGKWFQRDKAQEWDEDTDWNGNNHISRATGSQWEHQRLYRTASGRWILHHWSQYQGTLETYEEIDDNTAARWLSVNGHGNVELVADQLAALEL